MPQPFHGGDIKIPTIWNVFYSVPYTSISFQRNIYLHRPGKCSYLFETCHTKRAIRVILIKMFICLFPECTLFLLICEILSRIAAIKFLLVCKHGVYAAASFAASVMSWYLHVQIDIQNFTHLFCIWISYVSLSNYLVLIFKFYTVPVCLHDINNVVNQKAHWSKQCHVSIFKHKNMTSFLNYIYCGWLKFRGVPVFVVFNEGLIHEFQYPLNCNFFVGIMKENTMATNFEPQECVIFVQFRKMKIEPSTVPHSHTKDPFCVTRLILQKIHTNVVKKMRKPWWYISFIAKNMYHTAPIRIRISSTNRA